MAERCFFVGHVFDKENIDDLRAIIKDACFRTGWNPLYADDRIVDGHILTDKIIPDIQVSEFCLFEISNSSKPNVFIELGIAKGMGKQCILLLRENSIPPSDLEGHDRLNYSSYLDLKKKLKRIFKNPPINIVSTSSKFGVFKPIDKYAQAYTSITEYGTISDAIAPARHSVQMLGLCGNPLENGINIYNTIKDMANEGCKFRFLHMKPQSNLLMIRSIEEDYDVSSKRLVLQSEASLQSLKSLRKSVDDPRSIEIGLYDRLPSLAYIQADNRAFIGPYQFGRRGIDSCWFAIEKNTNPLIFKQYLDMYDRLWTDDKTEKV